MSNLLQNVRVAGPAFLLRHPDGDGALAPVIQGHTDEEMEAARAEAFRRGQAEAWKEVAPLKAELEAETQRAVEGLRGAAEGIATTRDALVRGAAAELLEFALQLAGLVVRRELAVSPEPLLPLLRELLERAASAERIQVRLSPRDFAFVKDNGPRLPEAASLAGLRFRPDSTLSPGDCVVETEQGNLDARISTQLSRLEAALRGALPAPGAEEAGA